MTCEWTIAHHTYEYCARRRNIPSVTAEMVWDGRSTTTRGISGIYILVPKRTDESLSHRRRNKHTSSSFIDLDLSTLPRLLHYSSLSSLPSAPRALPLACFARSGPNPNPNPNPNNLWLCLWLCSCCPIELHSHPSAQLSLTLFKVPSSRCNTPPLFSFFTPLSHPLPTKSSILHLVIQPRLLSHHLQPRN